MARSNADLPAYKEEAVFSRTLAFIEHTLSFIARLALFVRSKETDSEQFEITAT